MRTKQYLAALCLPLAFAACSDEEFVTDTPSLGSRGTVNVTLNATKPGFDGITTRMVLENKVFKWEKDVDMLGAALADGAKLNTIANDVFVNYPFTAQSSAATSTFNSKSAITQGHYLFYYSYQDHLDRGPLDLNLPTQTFDVALAKEKDGKDTLQQAVAYMKMISPIVNLSAAGVGYEEAQSYNLNLSFVNLYTIAKVIISSKNINGTTPKLKKVTLNAGGSNGFVKTAKADMTAIAASGDNIVTPTGTDKQIDGDAMKTAIEAIEALVGAGTGNAASTIYTSATNGAAELNIEGDFILSETEVGKEPAVYILVPKGKYNDGLTLTVETTEGVYTKNIAKKPGADLILDNQIQRISAELDFSTNVEAPEEFSIGSTSDWNNAIEFIESHSSSYMGNLPTFNLTSDVTIPSLPAKYIIQVEASAAHTLTISNDGTLDSKRGVKTTGDNVTLAVASGATLALNNADCGFAIENNGTLNVNVATYAKKITNLGTMNVTTDVSLTGGLENGAAAEPAAISAVTNIINIPEGKNLTIASAVLTNNAGTITVDGTLTNNIASSTNAGQIVVGAKGVLAGEQALTNTGTIENYGTLTVAITNEDGTFVIKDGSKGNGSVTITKGTVIVENPATLPGSGEAYKFASSGDAPVVTTEVTTDAEYTDAKNATDITNITLSTQDEWKIGGEDNLGAPGSGISLTLKGVKVTIGAALSCNIIAESGASVIAAASPFIITGALTVAEGATLTVKKDVTFNATQKIPSTAVATILGELNVEAGAALYFNTAAVGSATVADAKLTVAGDKTTGGTVDAGVFGVNVADAPENFENWGTIFSLEGETAGDDKKAGQISAAKAKSAKARTQGLGVGAIVEFTND